MEDYVSVIRDGENVYYLNANGRALVNCEKVRKRTGNIDHYIMRNHLYIAMGCPATWRNEIRIVNEGASKKDKVVCVADALFKQGDAYCIVEVDNTQTMKKNQAKVEKYRKLKERMAFGMMAPKFIWITSTDYRRNELRKLSEGLNVEIYTTADFNAN